MPRSAPAPAWCSFTPRWLYQGPGLVARIKRSLLACLARDGFANVTAMLWASLNAPKIDGQNRKIDAGS